MIEQQAGLINQLIYQQTVYYGGQHRLYPSITQLFHLLDDIVALGCTTHSISIVPFYRSAARGGFQEELDIGGFYIECRECVTQEEISRFPLELATGQILMMNIGYSLNTLVTTICAIAISFVNKMMWHLSIMPSVRIRRF